MSSHALARDALMPRTAGGSGRGLGLSVLVHAGLLVALAFGVNWRSRTPEAQQAAREKAAREAQAAQQLGQQRQQQQSIETAQQQSQRDADCAYLRGEIDSIRRLRNALVNRPFYSLDDLDQMDRHVAGLQEQYRRVCGP